MDEYIKRETLLTDICNNMCGLKYTGVCENCRIVALIANTQPLMWLRYGMDIGLLMIITLESAIVLNVIGQLQEMLTGIIVSRQDTVTFAVQR